MSSTPTEGDHSTQNDAAKVADALLESPNRHDAATVAPENHGQITPVGDRHDPDDLPALQETDYAGSDPGSELATLKEEVNKEHADEAEQVEDTSSLPDDSPSLKVGTPSLSHHAPHTQIGFVAFFPPKRNSLDPHTTLAE